MKRRTGDIKKSDKQTAKLKFLMLLINLNNSFPLLISNRLKCLQRESKELLKFFLILIYQCFVLSWLKIEGLCAGVVIKKNKILITKFLFSIFRVRTVSIKNESKAIENPFLKQRAAIKRWKQLKNSHCRQTLVDGGIVAGGRRSVRLIQFLEYWKSTVEKIAI